MGFYVYCVVPSGHQPPAGLKGLAGSEVHARVVGELAIWISDIDRPEPGTEQAKTHNRVVEAAVTQDVTPVPVRFGQWSSDWTVVDQAVRTKATWYHDRLRAFSGALEFGVRVLAPAKPASAQVLRSSEAVTGLEYMEALRVRAAAAQAERDDVQRVCAGISEILGTFVREEKLEQPHTAHGLINVVHLVPRDRFDSYRAHRESLRARFPDLRFLLSGPWVPYSFAV